MNAAICKLPCLLVLFSGTAFFLCACKTSQPAEAPISETQTPVPVLGTESEKSEIPEPVIVPDPLPPEPEPKDIPRKTEDIVWQANRLGAIAVNKGDGLWVVEKGERRLELTEKSRKATLNGTVVFLNEVFSAKDGAFILSESDFEYTLRPALEPEKIVLRSKIVVLDPGHGGAEPGSENRALSLLEKDLNLDVAIRLQKLLEENGYKVILTRYNDRLVPLEVRSSIANRSNAGIFLSIHFNAALSDEASGIETYFLTPPESVSSNDDELGSDAPASPGNEFDRLNFELGYRIQSRLIADLQRVDRGIKKARFKVLKDLECPGLLVECGFLSHGKESLLVNTPVYRQKLAESLSHSLTTILMSSEVSSERR